MRTKRHNHDYERTHKENNHMRTEREHTNENTCNCGEARAHGRDFGARTREAWGEHGEHAGRKARRTHRDGRRHGGNRAAFMAGRNFGEEFRSHRDDESFGAHEGGARRTHRDGRRHGGNRAAFMAGRGFGEESRSERRCGGHRHEGDRPRGAMAGRKGGRGELRGVVADLQMQVAELERKLRRMRRAARHQHADGTEQIDTFKTHRRVVRSSRPESIKRHNRRAFEMGRRMGRATHADWQDRQPEA